MLTTLSVFASTQRRLAKRLPYPSEEHFLHCKWKRRPTDISFIWMKNMQKMQDIGLIRNEVYLVKICWRLACSLKLVYRSQQAKLCKGSISPSWHSAALFHSYEQQGQVGHSLLYTLDTEESYSQYICVLNVDAAWNTPNLSWWY